MEKRAILFLIPGDPRGQSEGGGRRTGSSLTTARAGCPGRLLGEEVGEVWVTKDGQPESPGDWLAQA